MSAKTHGLRYSREWGVWATMMSRCYNPNAVGYPNYGARGIRVCLRWHKFENFYADMGPRPRGGTIERINNDGHYTPRNCRWATRKEQARNRRTNRPLTYNSRTQLMEDWARELGINPAALHHRLKKWSIEQALTTPKPERPNAKLNMKQAREIRAMYPKLSYDKIAAQYDVSKKTVLNIVHGRIFIE